MGKQDGTERQVTAGPVDDSTATILHVDIDAFFASVELLDHPELVGKPVIVGHPSARSIVTAATYEARKFGVNSALPMAIALKRCPQAIILEPHYERYTHYSRIVMGIWTTSPRACERLGIDEAFLDVAGARSVFGSPVQVASLLRERVRVRDRARSCRVGAAATKFVAKVASGLVEARRAARDPARRHGRVPASAARSRSCGAWAARPRRCCAVAASTRSATSPQTPVATLAPRGRRRRRRAACTTSRGASTRAPCTKDRTRRASATR